jgi:hypothetical protein
MKARWMVILGLLAVAVLAAAPLVLPTNKAGRVQYLDATEVPGASSAEIMRRARAWLAHRAHSDEDISEGDQPHCIMVGDSFQVPHARMPITVFYTLAFEARDHELCATVGALTVFDGSVQRPIEYFLNKDGTPKMKAWLLESVDRQAKDLLADLRHDMAAAAPAAEPGK